MTTIIGDCIDDTISSPFVSTVVHHYARASTGEFDRQMTADSPAGTGDHDGFIVEF